MLRTPETQPERFMLDAYKDGDTIIADELQRLRREGVEPTCRRGCHFCCRQPIQTTLPEGHAVGQFIKRTFTPERMAAAQQRTEAWLVWQQEDLPRLVATGMDEHTASYNYGPFCPLLENGECGVYPVRPSACRTHYVSSDPASCRPLETDPAALPEEPTMLRSIPMRTSPVGMRVRDEIEARGVPFERAVSLLPIWVAAEMGWKRSVDD